MECPRCSSNKISTIATSPVGDVWEVYECDKCYYSWRSTETPHVDDVFKLNAEKIASLQVIPPIPPLESE